MLLALSLAAALTPAQSTEFFIIKGENMYPRLAINQRVEFDMSAYATQPPQVGDIVILHPPTGAAESRCGNQLKPGAACAKPSGEADTSVRFVDRVVAVGGDRISLRRGRVVRNGKLETRKNIRACRRGADGCTFPRTIPFLKGTSTSPGTTEEAQTTAVSGALSPSPRCSAATCGSPAPAAVSASRAWLPADRAPGERDGDERPGRRGRTSRRG
jgi:hypothetical protein